VAHAEPAGHTAQSACERALVVPLNEPASHGVAAPTPSPHQLPASHASHAVAPSAAWYVPAPHAAQVALPLAAATLPAAHALGAVAPLAHAEPAGHAEQSACDAPPVAPRYEPSVHSVTELAPAPHQPPASHASHPVASDDDWNSPAAQSAHALSPPLAANEPGGHCSGVALRSRQ